MVRGEAVGLVWPSYQLMQVEDMFLDSCLVTEIFGKGHDVAKADTQHGREGLSMECHSTRYTIDWMQ